MPEFLRNAGRILNSGQSRTVVLTGNLHDLFPLAQPTGVAYVPVIELLGASWKLPDVVVVVYELNAPIRFLRDDDADKLREAWLRWRTGMDSNQLAVQRMLAPDKGRKEVDAAAALYDETMRTATGNPTLALEFLRQLCLCARGGGTQKRALSERLLVLIEGADLLLPDAPIPQLNESDRHRVSICHDWFSDPGFVNGADSVVLLAESRSFLHHRISRLPQLVEIEIPAPDAAVREEFIGWFQSTKTDGTPVELWSTNSELARFTAGLSLHALHQLLRGARHERRALTPADVVGKVESFIQSQLGDDIIEFKKPSHTFRDVVGNTRLKRFLQEEFIPRVQAHGSEALAGAAVCGPIGGGKTFVFEAVATELDMVVLVLKNLRSQWFGQTDVLFERLRRVLMALSKVLIFVDEADTQFGGVGADTHETERRLTGKLQAMMSDPALRGRVVWLLVTARIHRLSPDLRRPGRAGDLIIPALDPEGEDITAWLQYVVKPVCPDGLDPTQIQSLEQATSGFSAAAFAALRNELKARMRLKKQSTLSIDAILAVIRDQLSPAIAETRRYQTLQALTNCTRRSLLPNPEVTDAERSRWVAELRELEARGIQ